MAGPISVSGAELISSREIMGQIVQSISGLQVRTVVENRTDWLPSDAVYPVPWRGDLQVVDLVIERDEASGYLFRYASRDGTLGDATSHATLAEAEAEAVRVFGEPLDWSPAPT